MVAIKEHDVVYDGDRKIHYLAAGPSGGPLIIFVHGWPAIARTWKKQLATFASLGFRAIAPDLPGYGKSTARKVLSDYAQTKVVEGMLALLADTGRSEAIWVGHDWGASVLASLVAHHPEVFKAIATITVPYKAGELGVDQLLKSINRQIYPADQYPYGQYDYMKYYEESFDECVPWFDRQIPAIIKALYAPGSPESVGKPAITSTLTKDGGWLGGVHQSLPPLEYLPTPVIDDETYEELVGAMTATGFWPGTAYYLHGEANNKYNTTNLANDGKLHMPYLFVHSDYDTICDSKNSGLADPLREACSNLTEVSIPAGHWVPQERPEELNAALVRFILDEVPEFWPGSTTIHYIKNKK
ncbi:Epoxide hydrolase [Pleurostoma richardsiae]|uniref:Epoxide hydrolase n=1 Tax=Pleurostoma richardsiae TaxID=41990 RepID=A0AA38RMN2_9PEZI|nr:Epoxide hydrolase [Pleurostoma richardsiae]